MRVKKFQIVFLGVGVLLHLINLYTNMKVIWYIGCICIIISPFLPGGFINRHRKESAKGQAGKGDSLWGWRGGTFVSSKTDSIDPDQEPKREDGGQGGRFCRPSETDE